MTKIDIISGFLGAGKTSFIQKLLKEALAGEQVVLIENEFGEIGIDGGFLKNAGIEIREMNQGCICCSLVGDFESSLKELVDKYHPDRIIIEPSGVGKLSDILGAVKTVSEHMDVELHAAVTVVDARKAKIYSKNFGEFFDNQIRFAGTVVLSRTDIAEESGIEEAVAIVRNINRDATVITTATEKLSGAQLLDIISKKDTMEEEMLREAMERVEEHEHQHEEHRGHHHEHHHEHEGGHDEHDHEGHGHHHHDHHGVREVLEDGAVIHHPHRHEHGEHEHEHDADEIFQSWAMETPHKFDKSRLQTILTEMAESEKYGMVVRAKGMLPTVDGDWMFFDMVPEQTEIRQGEPCYTGKVVVIGADLKEELLRESFLSCRN